MAPAAVSDPAFRPARWLTNGHAQTVWQALAPRRGPRTTQPERWELPDGDFLDLSWVAGDQGPLIIVLHGLEGSVRSSYCRGLMAAIEDRGWSACLMHFRNCSDEPNRLARSYHSGETGDLCALTARLRRRFPTRHIGVVGFSLGGNVLLKWLGEQGADAKVDAAAAVCVPMRLDLCANRMELGLSRLYQSYLTRRMRRSYQRKLSTRDDLPVTLRELPGLTSFRRFDQHITAPLNGFAGATDYYRRCSSRQYLAAVRTPTLILQALDDPFMTPAVLPADHELSPSISLEVSRHGGHVGFVTGRWPWRPRYWLDERIPAWFNQQFSETPDETPNY